MAAKRVKLAPTPRMKRGTYTDDQVLAWVEERIKEEPRRLNMRDWVLRFRGKITGNPHIRSNAKPACGTVACAAGWINIGTRNYENHGCFSGDHALRLMGLKDEGYFYPQYTRAGAALNTLFVRSRLKAKDVLKELAQIRKDHAEELQSKTVVVE